MLRGLKERGMTPMVTLHHFSDPLWLYEMCGWENDDVVPLFEKFVRKTVEALKEYVTTWCTINEPNVYALMGYVTGEFPACNKGVDMAMKVMANMLRGACCCVSRHSRDPARSAGWLCLAAPSDGARNALVSARSTDAQNPLQWSQHGFPIRRCPPA